MTLLPLLDRLRWANTANGNFRLKLASVQLNQLRLSGRSQAEAAKAGYSELHNTITPNLWPPPIALPEKNGRGRQPRRERRDCRAVAHGLGALNVLCLFLHSQLDLCGARQSRWREVRADGWRARDRGGEQEQGRDHHIYRLPPTPVPAPPKFVLVQPTSSTSSGGVVQAGVSAGVSNSKTCPCPASLRRRAARGSVATVLIYSIVASPGVAEKGSVNVNLEVKIPRGNSSHSENVVEPSQDAHISLLGNGAPLLPASLEVIPVRLQDTPVVDVGDGTMFVSCYRLNRYYKLTETASAHGLDPSTTAAALQASIAGIDNEPRDEDPGTISTYTLNRQYEFSADGTSHTMLEQYKATYGHAVFQCGICYGTLTALVMWLMGRLKTCPVCHATVSAAPMRDAAFEKELTDAVKEGTVEGTGVEAEASYMWDDVEFRYHVLYSLAITRPLKSAWSTLASPPVELFDPFVSVLSASGRAWSESSDLCWALVFAFLSVRAGPQLTFIPELDMLYEHIILVYYVVDSNTCCVTGFHLFHCASQRTKIFWRHFVHSQLEIFSHIFAHAKITMRSFPDGGHCVTEEVLALAELGEACRDMPTDQTTKMGPATKGSICM
ncbi:hypothetical protein K438DRAFT_1755383 [Mycena galopus ATCC 62051]|nr:hypothetical protein K438DRAFT_1755383 [Mycena galopus ATCC 62051]